MGKRLISFATGLAVLLTLFLPAAAANEGGQMELSQEGLRFIKGYEGFRSKAYQANGAWYIGYGTSCKENEYPNGITEEEGEALMMAALVAPAKKLNQFLDQNGISLAQHEFDALISFTYSLGSSWMSKDYRIGAYLIQGLDTVEDAEIVDALGVWCHVASKVDEGALQRRIDEGRLLLYGDYGDGDAPEFCYLILDANGGTIVNDTVCYEAGKPYGSLPAATRAKYSFAGWYTKEGEKLAQEMTVSKNLRVTARWTAEGDLGFSDVKKADWFYTYVYDLHQDGVISGHTDGTFAPQESLTRGQALKLILLAAGHPEQRATGAHWASGYLDYGVKQGMLSADAASLDEDINRLEIAHIAAKALECTVPGIDSPFGDTTDTSVLALYELGILEGSYEEDVLVFKPNSDITRAEISAVIWRINQLEKKPGAVVKPPAPPQENHTNQFQYGGKWVDILPKVPVNKYDSSLFYKTEKGRILYNSKDYRCETGIDVSVYQGDINWEKVKADGIDFAIIRVGGRGYGSEGSIYADQKFQKNIEGALNAGMEVGVYFFSQAITVEEAIEEARYTLEKIEGYDITYPVVFDWEQIGSTTARTYNLAVDTLSKAANAFCKEVEDAGYDAMIYFNAHCGYFQYDLSQIVGYPFWFAQYPSSSLFPNFYYHYDMWQYTDAGKVDGIAGKVDMDLYLIPK